jgi:hypothetical protein
MKEYKFRAWYDGRLYYQDEIYFVFGKLGYFEAYFYNDDEDMPIFTSEDNVILMPYTGKITCKGNEIYDNDIVFIEDETDEGDRRIYFICKWIPEWAGFTFLSYGELLSYEDNGVSALNDPISYNLENSEKYHYAGNYIQNPELLIN